MAGIFDTSTDPSDEFEAVEAEEAEPEESAEDKAARAELVAMRDALNRKAAAEGRLVDASKRGDVGGIRDALADDANVDDSRSRSSDLRPVELAALFGHPTALAYLHDRGAELTGRALSLAARAGRPSCVALILERAQFVHPALLERLVAALCDDPHRSPRVLGLLEAKYTALEETAEAANAAVKKANERRAKGDA